MRAHPKPQLVPHSPPSDCFVDLFLSPTPLSATPQQKPRPDVVSTAVNSSSRDPPPPDVDQPPRRCTARRPAGPAGPAGARRRDCSGSGCCCCCFCRRRLRRRRRVCCTGDGPAGDQAEALYARVLGLQHTRQPPRPWRRRGCGPTRRSELGRRRCGRRRKQRAEAAVRHFDSVPARGCAAAGGCRRSQYHSVPSAGILLPTLPRERLDVHLVLRARVWVGAAFFFSHCCGARPITSPLSLARAAAGRFWTLGHRLPHVRLALAGAPRKHRCWPRAAAGVMRNPPLQACDGARPWSPRQAVLVLKRCCWLLLCWPAQRLLRLAQTDDEMEGHDVLCVVWVFSFGPEQELQASNLVTRLTKIQFRFGGEL
jgi:hypothetical protein